MTSQVLLNLLSNAIKFTAAGSVYLTVVGGGEAAGGRRVYRFEVRRNDDGLRERRVDYDSLGRTGILICNEIGANKPSHRYSPKSWPR
jgi:hypothetical protein